MVKLFNIHSPFEKCLKAISKRNAAKFKKNLKVINVGELFRWDFHKEEQIHLIHYISSQGSKSILQTFLLENYDDSIHLKTASGWTTLHFAVKFSNYEIIEELLSRGVEVDAFESSKGFSALHMAIEKRNMGAVKRLVEGMADLYLPAMQQDKKGLTPKELAEKNLCRQIIKYIEEYEAKNKFEKNMQRLATQQEDLVQRNADLEAKIKHMSNEMVQKISAEISAKLGSIKTTQCHKQMPYCVPPPIPPRKNHNSMNASNSYLCSSHLVPVLAASTPIPSPKMLQTKEEWLKCQTIANPLEPNLSISRPPSTGQFHFHFHNYDSHQSLVPRSNLDLTAETMASGQTSGIGSQLDIPEEEDVLSNEARIRILRNFDRFIYYLRYDRLSATLITKGILTSVDIEHLSLDNLTNSQRMTYIFNEVILKGTNATLRLFLETLEENDYVVHANTIRESSVLDRYCEATSRNMKSKSMPFVNKNGYQALTLEGKDD